VVLILFTLQHVLVSRDAVTHFVLGHADAPGSMLQVVYVTPDRFCPVHCYNIYDVLPKDLPVSIRGQFYQSIQEPVEDVLFVAAGRFFPHVGRQVGKWKHANLAQNIGLFERDDEANNASNAKFYRHFDYVIRNYFFDQLESEPMIRLQALGNISCGTLNQGFKFPPLDYAEFHEPRLGVFWFLPLKKATLPDIPRGSLLFSSQRRIHCCFLGSRKTDRLEMQQEFVQAMQTDPTLNCKIEIFDNWGGKRGPYVYAVATLAQCMVSLIPAGVSPETIRLMEALTYGSIPLLVDSPDFQTHSYINKLFQRPPVIRTDSWRDAVHAVQNLRRYPQQADWMQQRMFQYYDTLQDCIKNDMKKILDFSFGAESS